MAYYSLKKERSSNLLLPQCSNSLFWLWWRSSGRWASPLQSAFGYWARVYTVVKGNVSWKEMETNKSQYQKEGKKKSRKPHFHNPLFILAHSGKITQKPVTNHLNLRLSTFLCFASQTVMCSSQRVKKPDFLPHTVALCEQYGGLHPRCRGSCWTWRGLSRQKYVQPSGPDLLRRGFWSWLCSGLSRPDLLFHKGQDSPSVCLVLQPADHTKPALPGSRHPPDLRESLCAVFGSTTYNLIEIRFLGFGWTQTGNIFKWK